MLSYMNLPLLCAAGAVVMDLNNGKVDNRWSILCLAAGLCAHLIRDGPGGLGEALCGALLPFLLFSQPWASVQHVHPPVSGRHRSGKPGFQSCH